MPFSGRWWDPPFFFPMRGALALSEHLAGLAVLSSPIQWLGGSPVLAYNICAARVVRAVGWFAYLLVARLTGSRAARPLRRCRVRLRAASRRSACPSAGADVPVAAAPVARDARLPGRRPAAVAAAFGRRVADSGAFERLLPAVHAGPAWPLARVVSALAPASAAGAHADRRLGVASLPFVPILAKYREVHEALGLTRGAQEIVNFSARPASFLNPPHLLAFWPARSRADRRGLSLPRAHRRHPHRRLRHRVGGTERLAPRRSGADRRSSSTRLQPS